MLSDFKKFVLRGNVVDLAVAIVIGIAFTAMVAAFVADFITPLIAAIFGKKGTSATSSFTFHRSKFKYGLVRQHSHHVPDRRHGGVLCGGDTARPR